MSYFQIIDSITNKTFSPIYLLYGDEPYFIKKICHALQKNVVVEESKTFDEKIIYAEKGIDINSLLCDLKSYPITGQSQLIIIRNAENLKNIDGLESYFVEPQISTVLVLCLNKDWRSVKSLKNKNWFKIINKKFVVFESKKLFENQTPNWIGSYIKEKGYVSTMKVNIMLAEYLGNDLEKITNEIDKLAIILTKKNISELDIENHVGISRDFNSFELQNSVAIKDYQKSQRIINYLIKNNHPVVLIISILYNFFSKLLILHSLKDKSKFSASSILKINPYFFTLYNSAYNNYSYEKCIQIITFLKEADLASKGVPVSDHLNPNFIQQLIYRIIHE
tara:strand:+ start:2390 stop:3397 length:1008 start_codon:yes stop_codon:yes gene_type:complete